MTKPPKKPRKKLASRGVVVRVKTAKKRSKSSARWLERQLNDPFVRQAKADGYRSRAAYKLLGIDEKFRVIKRGAVVVDLGAAPGSWSQVCVEKGATVVGIDLLPVEPMPGMQFLEGDFMEEDSYAALQKMLPGKVDVVLSDMAANATGHTKTDHIRIIALCEAAALFARDWLKPKGALIMKVLQGGTENQLLNELKKEYTSVKHFKPDASRKDSAELYLIATGFKG